MPGSPWDCLPNLVPVNSLSRHTGLGITPLFGSGWGRAVAFSEHENPSKGAETGAKGQRSRWEMERSSLKTPKRPISIMIHGVPLRVITKDLAALVPGLVPGSGNPLDRKTGNGATHRAAPFRCTHAVIPPWSEGARPSHSPRIPGRALSLGVWPEREPDASPPDPPRSNTASWSAGNYAA